MNCQSLAKSASFYISKTPQGGELNELSVTNADDKSTIFQRALRKRETKAEVLSLPTRVVVAANKPRGSVWTDGRGPLSRNFFYSRL